ncbi:MAG: MBL fold metallo-hydrolase [Sulfuritalea sp.]|nr:MBL fold metallo-hydrolase [Sulfuritalea sp.]
MIKIQSRLLLSVVLVLCAVTARADYLPKAEPVAEHVYAIVGPLGQRSAENDGLNANYGFIVTPAGTILIDSGASRMGAEKLEKAIRAVTEQPVRWVINTGSQDHRWLGNDYFASRGAQIIAMQRTAATQARSASQQLSGLERFLDKRLAGTRPLSSPKPLAGETAEIELGGERLTIVHTDAHFPGDAMVILPKRGVVFTGDLVYVDRMLAVLPGSSMQKAQNAFKALVALKPAHVVPGHGRVSDLARAQRDTGDYYDFLINTVGTAAKDMEPMADVLRRHADLPAFRHLENYDSLHRTNMNRVFTEFEGQ